MLFSSNSFLITVFSVADNFPQVSLNFAGGASLVLRPQDYLIRQSSIVSIQVSISLSFSIFRGLIWILWFPKILILSQSVLHLIIIEEPLSINLILILLLFLKLHDVPFCKTFYIITYFTCIYFSYSANASLCLVFIYHMSSH